MIDVVVRSMPRGSKRAHFKPADLNRTAVLGDAHFILRDRPHLAPKPSHFVPKNAGRGFHQPRGIDQMARAPRMNMNRRAQFGETPRRSRVIEVDVAEENVAHVVRRKAGCAHRRGNIPESRVRAGVEKDDAVTRLERGHGDDAGPAQVQGVEDVDHLMR